MTTNEKGAGTTGAPASTGAGVGTERLIVLNSIYSPATAKEREAGNYSLGKGTDGADGSIDRFRDLLGRYWTKNDEGENLIFLNKKLGKGSADSNLNIPCDLYVTKPVVVANPDSGASLGEYEQTIIIDPDPIWLKKVAKPIIEAISAGSNIETVLAEVIKSMESGLTPVVQIINDVAKEEANKVVVVLLAWWQALFDFEDKVVSPLGEGPLGSQELGIIQSAVGWIGAGDEVLGRGTWFDDYSCRVVKPYEANVTTVLNSGIKSSVIDLKSIYNFYIRQYETAITTLAGQHGGHIREQILPNLYALISSYIPEKDGSEIYQTSTKFNDLIYLGGEIKETTEGKPALTTTKGSAYDYFAAWALAIQNMTDLDQLSPISDMYTNILFPSQDVGMLKYYNNYKFMFPMYNDLRFTTDNLTSFSDTLRSTKLADNFMRYYVTYGDLASIGPDQELIGKEEQFVMKEVRTFLNTLEDGSIKAETVVNVSQESIKVMNFFTWVKSVWPEMAEETGGELADPPVDFPANAIFMTTNENEIVALGPMESALMGFSLYGQARKIAKSYMRHYGKMAMGQSAHSETLMYKVEKYEEGFDDKLQTFYFFNSNEIEVLRFVDTQVHYNTKYIYKIFAVQLVVGTEYMYGAQDPNDVRFVDTAGSLPGVDMGTFLSDEYQEDLHQLSDMSINEYSAAAEELVEEFKEDPEAKFDQIFGYQAPSIPGTNFKGSFLTTQIKVRLRPNLKIIEMPYAEIEGRILDKPPIFPDVNIVPYKGVNNRALININNQVGEYFMKPIIFSQEEKIEIEDIRDAQKITDENKPIRYKSDDPVGGGGFFQIFRMERKPVNYTDFADNLLTTIDGTIVSELSSMHASSAAYADVIKPNKKYYYTFRTVDAHGHVSNPSPVFEIEMVDDSGTIYMVQKVVMVGEEDLKGLKKGLKKYLQIKPTMPQGMFNGAKMKLDQATSAKEFAEGGKEIVVGTEDESVWGKRFKIRLTSRSTGRQLDLNVNFEVEQNKASEDLLTQPVDIVPQDDEI